MFPVEILTGLGGALFSGVMTLWANSQKYNQEKALLSMRLEDAHMKFVEKARTYKDSKFDFAKRTIAFTIMFTVFLAPILMAFTNHPITIGYTEFKEGFSFLSIFNWGGKEVTTWHEVKGFALTPLYTHSVMAVLGMYFGYSVTKR